MMHVDRIGRNATVCGCSSMVEQKLPKLRASAEYQLPLSKTPLKISVSIQTPNFPAQNKIGPERGCRLNPTLTTKPVQEVTMADAFPKAILPYLEGKIGELRIMRFWSKVDMRGPDECWLWQESVNRSGYGRFKMASYQTVTASRFALICTKRQEPAGLLVLHHCDTPACCNPHHLYFGTSADNTRDKVERGRARTGDQRGENNPRAKLTEDQVALIVRRLKSGWNNKQIAADLPVTHSMVSLIRLGRMWRETTERIGWQPYARPTPTPEAM